MNDTLTNTERVHLKALAGLLHDVGKLAQRAGWQTGKHTEIGSEFVSRYVPEDWCGHLYPVMGHHDKPLADYATKVVSLSDRLSAAEREGQDKSSERQLLSILSRVGEEGIPRERRYFWPLSSLELTEVTIFPAEAVSKDQEDEAYRALWDGFVGTVEKLPTGSLPVYLEGMYYALQRFSWCVPGAYYRSQPDVSLFDHSRTTAALAACLDGIEEERIDDLLAGKRQEEPVALLVGGDISGVQNFIYTITARGAAKGLRGRSFYLEMLTEAVTRYLLRKLDLPITNLLYAGGGHFYLLAPPEIAEQLKALRADVSRKLLDHHGGDLYLALGWTRVSAAEFDRERFSEKWREVSQAMNAAKRQRFAELDDAESLCDQVFGPVGEGGDKTGECQVCHYDGPVSVEHKGNDDERRVCNLCQSLEELGTDLRDADYLLLGEVEMVDTERAGYREALRAFGLAVSFLTPDGRSIGRQPADTQRAILLALRDTSNVVEVAARVAQDGFPVAPGARYTANVTPRKGDRIATFEDLQDVSRGVRRLGVLRMDVDDLGDLFKWGMQDEGTLSRVASLSFTLSLFFEGWVGECCRQVNAKGPDKVYAIYSGGDDLFIVGAWDELPGLADTIRRDLARFAGQNPDVHISGGLTLHAGKYPLYQAAHDADHALDTAKDLLRPDGGHAKDAFHFLGLTIPWEHFDDLQGEQERLLQLVTAKEEGGLDVDRALLRTLIKLYVHFADAVHEHGKPVWGPWMWQGAYFLKRMEGRYQDNAQAEVKRIREALKENDFRYIETLGPAARWVELLMRKEQER